MEVTVRHHLNAPCSYNYFYYKYLGWPVGHAHNNIKSMNGLLPTTFACLASLLRSLSLSHMRSLCSSV